MSLLNITCPICTEVFNNADDVYSTSCGHLFHLACMSDWQNRSTSCPQCRSYNPTTHKLYLSFDENDNDDTLTNLEEMKQKLKSSNERIIELQVQNSELEINFMKLQEQYTLADGAKRALELNIKQMNDSEEHFMQLQGQYTEASELVKSLEDRIKQLGLDNESNVKQLELTVLENESLKASHRNSNHSGVLADSVLEQKLKVLEQKLRNITEQLEQEIDKNTKLTIEKMKLESYVKNMSPVVGLASATAAAAAAAAPNKQTADGNKPNKVVLQPGRIKRKGNRSSVLALSRQQGEPRNKSIRIKNLPSHLIVMPLELIVVNMAAKCNMLLCTNDLIKASFMDATQTKLFAEFKNSDTKEKFLARKHLLKKEPLMAAISIREFLNEDVHELYKYAKEKLQLHHHRYKCIFAANNKVYAKAYNEQCDGLCEITSKQQVDNLLTPPVADSAEKSSANGPLKDENYYQISA